MKKLGIVAIVVFATVVVSHASALEPRARGFFETGSATVRDSQGIKYIMVHEMRTLPAQKTPDGVILADVDKQLTLFAYRGMSCADFKALVRPGLDRGGLVSSSGTFVGACSQSQVRPRSRVFVRYEAASKTTTLAVEGGTVTTLKGVAPMRAVWRSFFTETPATANALTGRL